MDEIWAIYFVLAGDPWDADIGVFASGIGKLH
jgi:hypothetical protein